MNHTYKKSKKIVIQVAGNGLYHRPRPKNSYITNPQTGTHSFGNFPEILHYGFDAGEIILKYGEHKSEHKGFGLIHIWLGHFKTITDPVMAEQEVCNFLNSVIASGEIFYEANGDRNLVFKSGAGTVILEKSTDSSNNTIYVVITAIPRGQKAGFQIGHMPP